MGHIPDTTRAVFIPISVGFMGPEGTHFSLAGKSSHQPQCMVSAPAVRERMSRSWPTMNTQPDSVCLGNCLDLVAHIVQWLPQLRTIAV
jgi:hypothetical protein